MKKLLLIPMFLLWTVSCTSNEADIQCEKDNSLVEIVQKYEYYKNNAQLQINETLSKLEGVDTRSEISTQISGMDLVNYLSNLSPAVVDSLYNIYCTVQAQEEYDEAYDAIITLLIENSSFEEVQALFNFTRLYIECGGKNMSMIENASVHVSPIIKDCMISCAATIDEFSIPETRGADSWCIHELTLKVIQSSLEGAVTDLVIDLIPGADVVGGCIALGMDVADAIRTAHEFQMCCLTHIS